MENETYAKEFIGALKDHVDAQQEELASKLKDLFATLTIGSLEGRYDLRLFWRMHGRAFVGWLASDSSSNEGGGKQQIQAALEKWLETDLESLSEHKRAFLKDAVGILTVSSLQKEPDSGFKSETLPNLLQAANVQTDAAGLRMLNLRLMAISSEYLENTSYSYIGTPKPAPTLLLEVNLTLSISSRFDLRYACGRR